MRTISRVTVPKTIQISLSIDTQILKDLDTLSDATGIPRVKIVNSVLDHYLYHNDLTLVYGHQEIKVDEILKEAKKE